MGEKAEIVKNFEEKKLNFKKKKRKFLYKENIRISHSNKLTLVVMKRGTSDNERVTEKTLGRARNGEIMAFFPPIAARWE